MATNNTKNFDFDQYNSILKSASTGLKLHLGVQLIKDVIGSLEYFDNPLESELRPIYVDLKSFHAMYKEHSAKAQKEKEDKNNSSKSIDNSTVPQIGVQDMMKMFQEFQRMQAAMAAGNMAAAQSAATGITEIQDGALHTQGDSVQQAA